MPKSKILKLKRRGFLTQRHLRMADESLQLVYMRLTRLNPAAADGFLLLMGDWREQSTRLKMLLHHIR